MSKLPESIQDTIDEFARLPGIGPKSAARITFYLLTKIDADIERFSEVLGKLKKELKTCSQCFNWTQEEPCQLCSDEKRNHSLVCVVEEPLDVIALDRAGFDGLFHVLGGVISPINGIGPEDIRIGQLVEKIRNNSDKIEEVILATNPSLEGEATAVYISEKLENYPVKITRLARGLPVGGDLEYADELTLSRSLEGRKEI